MVCSLIASSLVFAAVGGSGGVVVDFSFGTGDFDVALASLGVGFGDGLLKRKSLRQNKNEKQKLISSIERRKKK